MGGRGGCGGWRVRSRFIFPCQSCPQSSLFDLVAFKVVSVWAQRQRRAIVGREGNPLGCDGMPSLGTNKLITGGERNGRHLRDRGHPWIKAGRRRRISDRKTIQKKGKIQFGQYINCDESGSEPTKHRVAIIEGSTISWQSGPLLRCV